jgi:hypothetical protein
MNTYIFIHGGESFKTDRDYIEWLTTTGVEWNHDPYTEWENKRKWREDIAQSLTNRWDLVYMPEFPSKQNAKYDEWKLFFDAWIRAIKIQWEVTLIGNSLGGCFLLKYFSEHTSLPWDLSIREIHLVAACIGEWDFTPPENYEFLEQLENQVHIWHAEDDDVVDISIAQELIGHLPEATSHLFSMDRWYGHFHGLEIFPEIKHHLI